MKQRTTSKLTRSISLSKVQILLHINDVVHLTKRKPYSKFFNFLVIQTIRFLSKPIPNWFEYAYDRQWTSTKNQTFLVIHDSSNYTEKQPAIFDSQYLIKSSCNLHDTFSDVGVNVSNVILRHRKFHSPGIYLSVKENSKYKVLFTRNYFS